MADATMTVAELEAALAEANASLVAVQTEKATADAAVASGTTARNEAQAALDAVDPNDAAEVAEKQAVLDAAADAVVKAILAAKLAVGRVAAERGKVDEAQAALDQAKQQRVPVTPADPALIGPPGPGPGAPDSADGGAPRFTGRELLGAGLLALVVVAVVGYMLIDLSNDGLLFAKVDEISSGVVAVALFLLGVLCFAFGCIFFLVEQKKPLVLVTRQPAAPSGAGVGGASSPGFDSGAVTTLMSATSTVSVSRIMLVFGFVLVLAGVASSGAVAVSFSTTATTTTTTATTAEASSTTTTEPPTTTTEDEG